MTVRTEKNNTIVASPKCLQKEEILKRKLEIRYLKNKSTTKKNKKILSNLLMWINKMNLLVNINLDNRDINKECNNLKIKVSNLRDHLIWVTCLAR